MSEFFGKIWDTLFDGSKGLSQRGFIILMIIITVVVADNIFGFTLYYNVDRKLSLVEKLNTVVRDSSLTASDKAQLAEMRTTLITRKSLMDRAWNFVKERTLFSVNQASASDGRKINPELHWWIHFFTAGSVSIVMMCLYPFGVIDKKSPWASIVGALIVGELLFYLAALLEAKLLALIPIVWGEPIINYGLNIFINFGTVYLIVKVLKWKSERMLKTP